MYIPPIHWKSGNISETALDKDVVNMKCYSYTAYLIAAIVMTLSTLKVIPLLQAFSNVIFCISDMSCGGPSAYAELLVKL